MAQGVVNAGDDVAPQLLYAWFRLSGQARQIRAGRYEIERGTTPRGLLRKLVRGEESLRSLTVVEGWTFRQLRQALASAPELRQETAGLSEQVIMEKLGRPGQYAEGRFFPDTYSYAKGSSDLKLLALALRTMDRHLQAAWQQRASNSQLRSPDQALILASIIEKETGRDADRPLIGGVFNNRLRVGMMLQTDPTVVYGMGVVVSSPHRCSEGAVDEAISITYYTDADGDGFGEDGTEFTDDCEPPAGAATLGGDCDDADNTVFPGATELCDNIDNNCDGAVVNNAGIAYYTDADADGYGDNSTETFSCTPIPGMITQGGDCDDANLNINPGAPDPCDELDQDCSGGPVLTTWYQDSDGDSYGTDAVFTQDCLQPPGFVPLSGDCDDANASIFPGNGCSNCDITSNNG